MKRQELYEVLSALRALHDAAQDVIDNWSTGDLAHAVNCLEEQMDNAKPVLDRWAKNENK